MLFDAERDHAPDQAECWELLRSATTGRLAVSVHNNPDIVPVEYHAQDGKILLRLPQGEMLVELTINPTVAFETSGTTGTSAWSVLVKGTARELQSWAEIDAAREKAERPWSPDSRGSYIEITPTSITGRRSTTARNQP